MTLVARTNQWGGGALNLCLVSGRSPAPQHTVADVDARLVLGEQWLLDPEHVTATDEALGGGAHGVVRKGLLYGHVPVALKVRDFRCGLLPFLRGVCV